MNRYLHVLKKVNHSSSNQYTYGQLTRNFMTVFTLKLSTQCNQFCGEIKLLYSSGLLGQDHPACNELFCYFTYGLSEASECSVWPASYYTILYQLGWQTLLMWIFRVNFISVCHYTSFPTVKTNTQTTIWLLLSSQALRHSRGAYHGVTKNKGAAGDVGLNISPIF